MKKYFTFIVIIFLFLMSGCGSKEKNKLSPITSVDDGKVQMYFLHDESVTLKNYNTNEISDKNCKKYTNIQGIKVELCKVKYNKLLSYLFNISGQFKDTSFILEGIKSETELKEIADSLKISPKLEQLTKIDSDYYYNKLTNEVFYVQGATSENKYFSFIPKADIKSFTVLNEIYAKDNNYVYNRDRIVEGADPISFKCLEEIYLNHSNTQFCKDKNSVFNYAKKIEGVEAASFEKINDYYIKDRNFVFWRNRSDNREKWDILPEADPKTFEIKEVLYYIPDDNFLNPYFFLSFDKNHFYINHSLQKNLDRSSIVILGASRYLKDKNNVYFIPDNFFADNQELKIVDGADVATFEVFGSSSDVSAAFDKNNMYKGGVKTGPAPKEIIKRGNYFLFPIEEKWNPAGTLKSKEYSSQEGGCGCYSGNLKCVFQIIDQENKILKEFETKDGGICVSYIGLPGEPISGWINNEEILVKKPGFGWWTISLYNVKTGKLKKEIFSFSPLCPGDGEGMAAGSYITENDRTFLFVDKYSEASSKINKNDIYEIVATLSDKEWDKICGILWCGEKPCDIKEGEKLKNDKLKFIKTIDFDKGEKIDDKYTGAVLDIYGKKYRYDEKKQTVTPLE